MLCVGEHVSLFWARACQTHILKGSACAEARAWSVVCTVGRPAQLRAQQRCTERISAWVSTCEQKAAFACVAGQASIPPQCARMHCITSDHAGLGIATAQTRLQAQVHNGMVFTRTADTALVWQEQQAARHTMEARCGFLVHLTNLFGVRLRPGDYPVTRDTSWHWALGSHVKPLG